MKIGDLPEEKQRKIAAAMLGVDTRKEKDDSMKTRILNLIREEISKKNENCEVVRESLARIRGNICIEVADGHFLERFYHEICELGSIEEKIMNLE